MKNKLMLILIVLTVALSSCTKIEELTIANITVKENSLLKSEVSVHMFDDNKPPNSNFYKPFYSDKTVVTNDKGLAVFKLKDVYDLSTVDDQTTLYFAVFDASDIMLGQTSITIEKGQTINKEILF